MPTQKLAAKRLLTLSFACLLFAWHQTLLRGAERVQQEIGVSSNVELSRMADLSRIAFDEDKIDEVFDLAIELIELGAGYEGARLIASIALTSHHISPRSDAIDYLEEWDLTPEEVLRGNKNIVHQKVMASLHQQTLPNNEFGHVRNLIKLNLLNEAATLLGKERQSLGTRKFKNKWGILLDEFGISVENFMSAPTGELLGLISDAHTYHHLKDRLPMLWFIDREAWKNTRDLLMHDQLLEWEKEPPFPMSRRKKFVWACLVAVVGLVLLGRILLWLGWKHAKWAKWSFIGICFLTVMIAGAGYYAQKVYVDPRIQPYAIWVKDRPDWDTEEFRLKPREELIPMVRRHARDFATLGQWKAVRLLSEVLLYEMDTDSDKSAEQTMLQEALEHLASIQNPFITAERPKPDEADVLFDSTKVRSYELELSREAIRALRNDPKTYVRGVFQYGDQVFEEVGVKLKGGWGSFRIIEGDSKPAFTIKFDAFKKEQRFYGLKRIILNNAVQDPTYLHEAVTYSIFRDGGVPAPRVGHATLKVNGEAYGLYVQVEAATKDYLKRWFDDPNGNLYEGPGGLVDWEYLDLDSNQEKEDRTRIRMFYEAVRDADPIDPWTTLNEWVDLDAFARFMANEQFVNNWDGYPEANNYRLYDDPLTGKFYFFPHGGDQTMEDSRHDMFGGHEEVVGRALVMTESGRQAYRKAIMDYLEHGWDPEKSLERIRDWYVQIRPHITTGLARFSEHDFEHNVTQIIEFVKLRPYIVWHQLKVESLRADWKEYHEDLPFIDP